MKDDAREVDVIDRLVQWANSQPLVRAMLLESSRASNRAPIDILPDYDVLLVVSEMRPFSQQETWLQDFGKILVIFRGQLCFYLEQRLHKAFRSQTPISASTVDRS